MQFSAFHRRYIAPALAQQTLSPAFSHLTLLHVGTQQRHGLIRQVLEELNGPGMVPLVLVHHDGARETLWPALAQASILLTDEAPDTLPWRLCAMGMDLPVVELAAPNCPVSAPRQLVQTLRDLITVPALRRRRQRVQRAYLETLDENVLHTALGPHMGDQPACAGGWRIEGPFDSSFSLAIVNRSLALELQQQGEDMGLGSVDAEGPRPPDPDFLACEPDVAALWRHGNQMCAPDVVMRNLWPPHVLDMRGPTRIMANYAWEESVFPPADVAAFNATLNLITVTSHYVTKVLRDNGVHTPIAMVGNGIFTPPPHVMPASKTPGIYRYLHVSSCYPRKGADVLLNAWTRGFTREDGVELVIKTFPNEHNRVAEQIAALKRDCPHHAPILLIEEDISEDRIHGLYASADAIVCPARGEGFGLPMAEAFAHGKPVVTTGYSGQRDFCTPETAWLCDFTFTLSRSHHQLAGSVWAEPDVSALIAAMHAVRTAPAAEIARRIARGRELLHRFYRWEVVAAKTRAAIAALDQWENAILHEPRIGHLAIDGSAHIPALVKAIKACKPDAMVLHPAPEKGILQAASRLAAQLESNGISTILQMGDTSGLLKELALYGAELRQVTRILVESVDDLNSFKQIGLIENMTLPPALPPEQAARHLRNMIRGLVLDRYMQQAAAPHAEAAAFGTRDHSVSTGLS